MQYESARGTSLGALARSMSCWLAESISAAVGGGAGILDE